ncbi:hypothetical protein HDU77_007767 [Chytriomyces hyalinus]|nr:hypothetical protein HDU77_007767 [Chytriomyces hyalinus]
MNARGYSTAPSGATELISHKDVFSSYRIFFLLFSRMPLHLHVVALQFPNFIDESKLPHLLFYGPPVEPPTSVVEKYTQNLRFCIICNYVSKIIPALQSRCARFRFAPIKEEFIRTPSKLSNTPKRAFLKLSKGNMRRMFNILQAAHAAYPRADEAAIYTCFGSPMPSDVTKITDLLFGETFDVVYSRYNLTVGCSEKIQLASLIGGFKVAVDLVSSA